ncbi:MAG: hypothetical protein AB7N54_21135 [Alphaproteobacteria bacterium]
MTRARWSRGLVAVYIAVNGLVLANAAAHHYGVGYDAEGHQRYIRALADGRLPSPADGEEYFAAPLPYVLPAVVTAAAPDLPFGVVLKGAQFLQVLYSLGLTYALVRLCRRVRPDDALLPVAALCLLGMLPVYYRTMAMVRGEALAACLTVVCLERALALAGDRPRTARAVQLGALLGLLLLAKQWGAFVVAAVTLWMLYSGDRAAWRPRLRAVGVLVVTAGLTGGWYYGTLLWRFGSVAAFNTPASTTGWLSAKPAGFLSELRLSTVGRDPVRPAFAPAPLLPTLYADTWGDYWCYWLVYGNTRVESDAVDALAAASPPASNRDAMARYLGRVNAVALVPSAVFLSGFGLSLAALWRLGRRAPAGDAGDALLGLTIAVSLAGYLLLLLRYPLLDVKASYLLHIVPPAAVLGGLLLCRVRAGAPRVLPVLAALLALSTVHNAAALVTRYPQWDAERSTLAGSPHEWLAGRRVD